MTDGIASWPRARLVAAVTFARRFGALPETPLARDPLTWESWQRDAAEAADEILAWQEQTGRKAFERKEKP